MGKIRKLNAVATPKYKYNLNTQIGLLQKNITMVKLRAHLAEHGITRDEFYRDRAILIDSDKSIPDDRMVIYAIVFDCEVHDLRNHQVKARSIREVVDDPPRPKKRSQKSSLK
jgi:hypothetical protein